MVREGRAFCRSAGNERIILKRPGSQPSEYVGRTDAPSLVFTPIVKRAYSFRTSGALRFLRKIGSWRFSELTIRYEVAIPRILYISEKIAPLAVVGGERRCVAKPRAQEAACETERAKVTHGSHRPLLAARRSGGTQRPRTHRSTLLLAPLRPPKDLL